MKAASWSASQLASLSRSVSQSLSLLKMKGSWSVGNKIEFAIQPASQPRRANLAGPLGQASQAASQPA